MASIATRPLALPKGGNTAALSPALTAALLLGAAFLIRMPHFGDPAFKIDEQFYLVAGDRLLHGQLPFVDVWDRKPFGLFAIYAVAAAFGPAAILAYQIMATLFAAATALVMTHIARPLAGAAGALAAGLLYLLWIEVCDGGGGQSPIFYNLPMAGAALAVLRAGATGDERAFRRSAHAAMALTGLSIQIKYTAVFEGTFFGLVLALWTWRRRRSAASAMIRVGLLAATALLPTLLAFAAYAALGHARDFWFANIVSIFLRAPTPRIDLIHRARDFLLVLAPFSLCIAVIQRQLWAMRDAEARRWRLFMLGWCAAAVVGITSIGTLYPHYLLPALAPFGIAASPLYRRRPTGFAFALLLALPPLVHLDYPNFRATALHRRQIAALTALIPPGVERGCLQVFDGPSILYWTTHACTTTRYIFPDHLSSAVEQDAVGIDTAREMRHVLARRTMAIVLSEVEGGQPNRRTFAILHEALARDYRLAGALPYGDRDFQVWVRR